MCSLYYSIFYCSCMDNFLDDDWQEMDYFAAEERAPFGPFTCNLRPSDGAQRTIEEYFQPVDKFPPNKRRKKRQTHASS